MRLLLIEDDAMIGTGIQAGLRREGYAVDWLHDAQAAESALAVEDAGIALALLDLGLPHGDGLALLETLRRRQNKVPVLVITARHGLGDRVRALDIGADDYLIKPFDIEELAARVRAVLRRRAMRFERVVEHHGLRLDTYTRKASVLGRQMALSAREFALLEAFLERPGRVLSREHLEIRVYGNGDPLRSNSIEVHIHNLRKKLGEGVIRTIRGVGYVLDEPRRSDPLVESQPAFDVPRESMAYNAKGA